MKAERGRVPTNLPPECADLEKKYLEARTLQEKVEALQAYLGAIPKHKGTEKLRRQIKTKLSKLRMELEERREEKVTSTTSGRFAIKKEGAAQIVILGFTNSGKSSLLTALTKAAPKILGKPFTTTEPTPGMMSFEDIQIQLVEAPAIFKGASQGIGWGAKVLSLARNADGLILLVDLADDNPYSQLETMIRELNNAHIIVTERKGRVEVERKENGGIQVICYGELEGTVDEVKRVLNDLGVVHAVVKIYGEVQIDDVVSSIIYKTVYKPTIVVANKCDVKDAEQKIESLRKNFKELRIIDISTTTGKDVDEIPRKVFDSLRIMRIYTKRVGQEHSERPMIMTINSTVGDTAKAVHSAFYKEFKYAKVWGSTKYLGERVGLNYILKDRDIVELHI